MAHRPAVCAVPCAAAAVASSLGMHPGTDYTRQPPPPPPTQPPPSHGQVPSSADVARVRALRAEAADAYRELDARRRSYAAYRARVLQQLDAQHRTQVAEIEERHARASDQIELALLAASRQLQRQESAVMADPGIPYEHKAELIRELRRSFGRAYGADGAHCGAAHLAAPYGATAHLAMPGEAHVAATCGAPAAAAALFGALGAMSSLPWAPMYVEEVSVPMPMPASRPRAPPSPIIEEMP